MTVEEESINNFLDNRDLDLLHEKPLVFAKSREFIQSEHSFAMKWFMVMGCVPCLAPIATFKFERLFDHFSIELSNDGLCVSAPVNWFCSVSVEKTRLTLESIVDVTLDDEKYCRQYGLKQMNIWAYGDTDKSGPSISVSWVAKPEQARDAILLAVSLRKVAMGLVPLPIPMQLFDDPKAAAALAALTSGTLEDTTHAVYANVADASAVATRAPKHMAAG